MPKESALATFLRQNGIEPTGDKKKDMELAKSFMPKGYKR